MPRDITVTFDDGSTHVYRGAPDNITPEQVTQRASKEFSKGVKSLDGGRASYSDVKPEASVEAGSYLRRAGRDVARSPGLMARYGLEGLGRMAEVATEPIRQIAVNPLLRMAGLPEASSTSQAASAFANMIGLPSPQNADERVIGDASRMVAAGGGMMGVARKVAGMTQGATKATAQALGANPVVQGAGAATAGLAGGSVREAGGGPMEQFVAALVGGVAGGLGAAKATDAARVAGRAAQNLMVPRADRLVQAEGAIEIAAQRSGVDLKALSSDVRRGLREEVANALRTGQPLDEAALARLIPFRATGTTPTVGMLTQNPVTITREQNLMRAAANSDDPALQQLPQLYNRNTQQLLTKLDDAGARGAPSLAESGRSAIDTMAGTAARKKAEIDSLYKAARDSSGRSLPLEGGTFTTAANKALDEANIGSFLPPDIARKMNDIAAGKYPLTVDVAEQLKTSIGNIQRGSTDGNVRRALGIVRQALDEAPLQNSAPVNPGNLPAVSGTVPQSTQAGEQSILAFNKARAANRKWMQRVEGNPALKAVADGVEPDQFVQKFVIGKGATAKDVAKLRSELDGASAQALKQTLVRYLKSKATNRTDDITKFSNQSFRNAMDDIGEDKLAVLFTAEERQLLKDIGDAGKYMQAQPAGSAVNNSNSGALLMARGWELLDKMAGWVPVVGKDIIRGKITQPMMQRQSLDTRNALVRAAQIQRTPVRVNPLLAAVMPAEAREDQ